MKNKMIKYEFGIMSSKWSLEAKNDDIAFKTILVFIRDRIPIIIWSPMKKVLDPEEVLNEMIYGNLVQSEINEVDECMKTITRIKN